MNRLIGAEPRTGSAEVVLKYRFAEFEIDLSRQELRRLGEAVHAVHIEPQGAELSKVKQQLAARKAPESLDAWDCYQRGLWNLWRFTAPGFDSAESYFQRAIAADPNFARGHGRAQLRQCATCLH